MSSQAHLKGKEPGPPSVDAPNKARQVSATPISKNIGDRSSKTSIPSKEKAFQAGRSKDSGLQEFHKESADASMSQIGYWASIPRRQDPYVAGQHFGERVTGLFHDMIDFEDRVRETDPAKVASRTDKASEPVASVNKVSSTPLRLQSLGDAGGQRIPVGKTQGFLKEERNSPHDTLSSIIASGNEASLEQHLHDFWSQLLDAELQWLRPLQYEYTCEEIAKLLLQDAEDSPWIYFEPVPDLTGNLGPHRSHHLPNCSHDRPHGPHSEYSPIRPLPASAGLNTNVWDQIAGLCGLGGVTPETRDRNLWPGQAWFNKDSDGEKTTSIIIYWRKWSLVSVLRRWRKAVSLAQQAGLCCDRFTILVRPLDSSARPAERQKVSPDVNLRSITFETVCQLHEFLESWRSSPPGTLPSSVDYVNQLCDRILGPHLSGHGVHKRNEIYSLHLASLVTQIICVGFLSYLNAHVGPLEAFFLDTEQRQICLMGIARNDSVDLPIIEAKLVQMTCIGDMLGNQVMVFHGNKHSASHFDGIRSDLRASGENCLDTWGSGHIYSTSQVYAIGLRGGYIAKRVGVDRMWHWAPGDPGPPSVYEPFSLREEICIGAQVQVNEHCEVKLDALESKFASALYALGTFRPHWRKDNLQRGVEAGPEYLKLTVVSGLRFMDGRTLKAVKLHEQLLYPWHCLEEALGLQVSLCTGVARRVRLRDLVAEVLPCFVAHSELVLWQSLLTVDIQSVFSGDVNLGDWAVTLPSSELDFLITLLRRVLEELKNTGIEASDQGDRSLVVAWITSTGRRFCSKIPAQGESSWIRILEDSDTSATFAYFTSKCLITEEHPCNKSSCVENARRVRILGTAICSAEADQVTAPRGWSIEDGRSYAFRTFDSKIMVIAQRKEGSSHIELLFNSTSITRRPEQLWRESSAKARRLLKRLAAMDRERRDDLICERVHRHHPAEDAFVRSSEASVLLQFRKSPAPQILAQQSSTTLASR